LGLAVFSDFYIAGPDSEEIATPNAPLAKTQIKSSEDIERLLALLAKSKVENGPGRYPRAEKKRLARRANS